MLLRNIESKVTLHYIILYHITLLHMNRFRYFAKPIETHSFAVIEAAFKTACILHNTLRRWDLNQDRNEHWWTLLDPDKEELDDPTDNLPAELTP